jgi:hypothetical protein
VLKISAWRVKKLIGENQSMIFWRVISGDYSLPHRILLNSTLTIVHRTMHDNVFSPKIYMGTLPSTPRTTGAVVPAASTTTSYPS